MPMGTETPSSYFGSGRSRSTNDQAISFRASNELVQRLAAVSKAEGGLSLSDTMRLVLERGLAASTKKGKRP